ncbi:hypothetical protein NSQ82_16025 [Caldifermentibacillus hisashii]|uniref:hypothetical protein n=1 Tax=Caldifermentibacillus hisashii TaxID=996558 RepID=UPI0031B708C7
MDLALALLAKYFSDIASWNIPAGGLRDGISTRKLFDLALQEGILINPGSIYDKNDQVHLRLSYSYASLADLEKGMIRLSELIKGLIG